jgi:hypothetical protein
MKMKMRDVVIPRLARSLRTFYPECVDRFLCPVCLTHFPTTDTDQITEAHILPKAVVKGPTTLLCRKCNNRHGELQDKWFGEHLHPVLNKRSVLGAKTQRGYFTVGGVRLGGIFEEKPDGSIAFQYWSHRTSPESLAAAEAQFDRATLKLGAPVPLDDSATLKLGVPIPLLEERNKKMVRVGYLTAAYLMIFRELGYSWALQSHLNPLRQQIMNPDAEIFALRISDPIERPFQNPVTGIGRLSGEATLIVGLADRIVLLPPADYPDIFDRLPQNDKLQLDQLREFKLYRGHKFDCPVVLLHSGRVLVAPDVLPVAPDWYAISLPSDGTKPTIIEPNRAKLRIFPTPDKYTGRP